MVHSTLEIRYYVLDRFTAPIVDRRCVPIPVSQHDDSVSPDGTAGSHSSPPQGPAHGLVMLWPGELTLDDVLRAAAGHMADASTTPYDPPSGGRPESIGEPVPGSPADTVGEVLPLAELAGRVVEEMRPGAELAAWLSCVTPETVTPEALNGFNLAGAAAAWRRLASWAQACELAAVAEMAARAAARDDSVPLGPDGGPARVPDDAADEVALTLRMSRFGASWWTDLAITLSWRLPATLGALRDGLIDLSRAKLITEATNVLSDEDARAVQDRVLPAAGQQTLGQLRAALRRAVISVDPSAAERRRAEAERRARVGLFADEEGTATLSGQNLPGAQSAAAMARMQAIRESRL